MFISQTASTSRFNAHALSFVKGAFNSITETDTRVNGYVRTYEHKPQSHDQSRPIFIYDKDERLQLVLSDNTISYRDGWFIEQLNGEEILEFEVIADHPDAELIQEDGRAVIRNIDGEFIEFIIRVVEDADDINGTFKSVEAEGGEYELIDEWITQYKASNITLRTALGAILGGTRWQIGVVDDFGTQSVDLRNMSVKAGIYELIKLFGGERKTRVETVGNRVTKRYLDVLKNRGVDTGKRFEAGKDIISSNRTIDSSGIKTALYGFGKSRENNQPRITFADVEWVKANGDPIDKPLGQAWVGDPKALQKYGYAQGTRHRFGSYDGQEEDPAELLFNTWKELQTLNHINETYDFNVIQLEELLGYAHEKIRLGDRTFAININVFPKIEVENSIIEYRQNLNDRKLSEVTLGNFRRTYDLSNRFDRVEKDVNEKQGNWDGKPDVEDVEDIVEDGNKWVQDALDEAQTEIDDANDRLDQAQQDIDDSRQYLEDLIIDVGDDATAEAIASAKAYADDNSVMLDKRYNGVSITNSTGFLTMRDDQLVRTVMNSTQGFAIQARSSTSSAWQNKLYADTDGSIWMEGMLNAVGGIFNGSLTAVDGTFTGTLTAVDGTFTGTLTAVDGNFVGTVLADKIIGNEINGVTLRTANSINYIHMKNQTLDFWNQNLKKMSVGFNDWGGALASDPFIVMGAGDSTNRNIVYINKKENDFSIAYRTTGSGESELRMTRQGNVELSAKDRLFLDAGTDVNASANLRVAGTIYQNGTPVALNNHNHDGRYVKHHYSPDDIALWVDGANRLVVVKNGSTVGRVNLS